MDNKELFEQIVDVVTEQLDVDRDTVTTESRIAEDLGADSLDKVELMMQLEEVLDIELKDEDLEKVETIQELMDLISTETK